MKPIDNIAEYLFSRRAKNLPPNALAEVFDRLIWCMDDNGKEICEAIKEWLEGNNSEKIEIALYMESVSPYPTYKEMDITLKHISKKYPQFQEKCHEIRESIHLQIKHSH